MIARAFYLTSHFVMPIKAIYDKNINNLSFRILAYIINEGNSPTNPTDIEDHFGLDTDDVKVILRKLSNNGYLQVIVEEKINE